MSLMDTEERMRQEVSASADGRPWIEVCAEVADQMVVETIERLAGEGHLTFGRFSAVNAVRCKRWHEDMTDWNISDWTNAMAGEAGEAANIAKKMRRIQTKRRPFGVDWTDEEKAEWEALRQKLGKEVADTITYADLCAAFLRLVTGTLVVDKFNEVSERYDFPERL